MQVDGSFQYSLWNLSWKQWKLSWIWWKYFDRRNGNFQLSWNPGGSGTPRGSFQWLPRNFPRRYIYSHWLLLPTNCHRHQRTSTHLHCGFSTGLHHLLIWLLCVEMEGSFHERQSRKYIEVSMDVGEASMGVSGGSVHESTGIFRVPIHTSTAWLPQTCIYFQVLQQTLLGLHAFPRLLFRPKLTLQLCTTRSPGRPLGWCTLEIL